MNLKLATTLKDTLLCYTLKKFKKSYYYFSNEKVFAVDDATADFILMRKKENLHHFLQDYFVKIFTFTDNHIQAEYSACSENHNHKSSYLCFQNRNLNLGEFWKPKNILHFCAILSF